MTTKQSVLSVSAGLSSAAPSIPNPYRDLGVEPIINCGSSRSFYGNSVVGESVALAMHAASADFVIMRELADAIGGKLARLTGAPWGMVSAGTASALALATAACVAANNPLCMLRLPSIRGMADTVLIPKGQRFAYDQSIRLTGCSIVEFDGQAELEVALCSYRVALVAIFGERMSHCTIAFETIVSLCNKKRVPVLVDAASEFLISPEPWIARGADLVAYSVGKVMRGPAATGLLLGRKDLVQAAWLNGSPNQSFGRAAKISKEQMVGAVTAVEKWLGCDLPALGRQWMQRLIDIKNVLDEVPQVHAVLLTTGSSIPRLKVEWSADALGLDFEQLRSELLANSPRILLDDFGGTDESVVINPFGLRDGEGILVGSALKVAFERQRRGERPLPVPAHSLHGTWALKLYFCNGVASHWFHLRQDISTITGVHGTPFGQGELRGSITGKQFLLDATHMVEANFVRFRFSGRVDAAGDISGRVLMGAAASHTKGPLTFGQFGEIEWDAVRSPS